MICNCRHERVFRELAVELTSQFKMHPLDDMQLFEVMKYRWCGRREKIG